MGMRGEAGNVQSRVITVLVLAAAFSAGAAFAQSDAQDSAFQYEERSTIHTIQLNSMEEETLANTVIEGGLAAPAAEQKPTAASPIASKGHFWKPSLPQKAGANFGSPGTSAQIL